MASFALHLKSDQIKAQKLLLTGPPLNFSHRFSSSASPTSNNGENAGETQKPQTKSSVSSYFSDVKARLKQQTQQQKQQETPLHRPLAFTEASHSLSNRPSKIASLEEIRKNLSEFRRAPTPSASSDWQSSSSSLPSQHISFQELYKRNVMNDDGKSGEMGSNRPRRSLSFGAIGESLRQLRATQNERAIKVNESMSLSKFKESLKLTPTGESGRGGVGVIRGTPESFPFSMVGKEMMEKKMKDDGKEKEGEGERMKTEFVKTYSYMELGEKLRLLRPEGVKKAEENWFSLTELNDRLAKLREMEMKMDRGTFKELREGLNWLKMSNIEEVKKSTVQRLDILGQLGGTPTYMLLPPKEHLVEQYFHPDNMSSAQKLKIELKGVRDEFKIHESDCGSARVQIAQLTTEINHLAAFLHKKDKHSRRGLLAKVQKRKTLLKYLRRTDWDSYCLVLSRLGLRDNPDYRN